MTGPKRQHFVMLPYLLDDSDLDPYEVRVYVHYQRLCWKRGVASETVRETATACRISRGKVLATRESLVAKGWIELRIVGPVGHEQTFVEVLDRWDKNDETYAAATESSGPPPGRKEADSAQRPGEGPVRPGGDTAVHHPASAVHVPDASVRVEGQCGPPPGRTELAPYRERVLEIKDLTGERDRARAARTDFVEGDEGGDERTDEAHAIALPGMAAIVVQPPPGPVEYECPTGPHTYSGNYGDHLATDPRHKISRPPRRRVDEPVEELAEVASG